MNNRTQPTLFMGLHWHPAQQSLLDDRPRAEIPKKPALDREQYAEGFRAGLAGRKLPAESHEDYKTGHEHGAADKRYHARCADHARVFRNWAPVLPGQGEMFT